MAEPFEPLEPESGSRDPSSAQFEPEEGQLEEEAPGGEPVALPGEIKDSDGLMGAMGSYMNTVMARLKQSIESGKHEIVEDLSESAAARFLWRAGGTTVEYANRTQGALIAGQRILLAEFKGENTADLLTPMEVLAGYDLRDVTDQEMQQYLEEKEAYEALEPAEKIMAEPPKRPGREITTYGEDGVPGARELLQSIAGDENVEALQESPFLIFGKYPVTQDNLARMVRLQQLEGVTADNERDALLTSEQVLRFGINMVNDVFLPFSFIGKPARGVRNVRHYLVDPQARQIASRVENNVGRALKEVDERAVDLMRFDRALAETDNIGIDESVDLVRRMFSQFEDGTRNSASIFKSVAERFGQLDPEDSNDIQYFARMIREIDDLVTSSKATGQEGNRLFSEGLTSLMGDANYTELTTRIHNFASRARQNSDEIIDAFKRQGYDVEEMQETGILPARIAKMQGVSISDTMNPGSLTERPVYLDSQGRMVFLRTSKQDITKDTPRLKIEEDPLFGTQAIDEVHPSTHPGGPALHYLITGRPLQASDDITETGTSFLRSSNDDAVDIRTTLVQDPETKKNVMYYEFYVPDVGLKRESLVDQIEDFVLNARPAITAQRRNNALKLRNQVEAAGDKAEADFYRSMGISADPELNEVAARKEILRRGRTGLRNKEKFKRVIRARDKVRNEAKEKARKEAQQLNASVDFKPRYYVNIGSPNPQVAKDRVRKKVPIEEGDITRMLSYNHSLRDIINFKAPVRPVGRIVNPITQEITYRMRKGSQSLRLQPRRPQFIDEFPDSIGLDDDPETLRYTLLQAIEDGTISMDKARRAKIAGTRNDVFIDDIIQRGTAAELAEAAAKRGNKSAIDDVEELADARRQAPDSSNQNEIGGRSAPPRNGDTTTLMPDEASPSEHAIRDISIGWVRDPENVLGHPDPSKSIYSVFAAAEYGQYRTRASLSAMIARHAKNIRRGSQSSERIGRVLAGKFTDANGRRIELTSEEQEAAVIIKEMIDTLAGEAGLRKSDNIKDYFTSLLQSATGSNKRIPPELLDTPVSPGNFFYGHMLPTRRGRKRKDSYDIVEAFRLFERAAVREAHIEPAIKRAKELADEINLPKNKRKYLNMWIDRMRGKPTSIGRLFEEATTNALERTGLATVMERLGIDFDNPLTRFAGAVTRGFYRGLLGGSAGFVFKNMTQSINTAAEAGALNTLYGISRMMTPGGIREAKAQKLVREFDNIFEDAKFFEQGLDSRNRAVRGLSKAFETVDDIIFKPVHFSEHVNRGIAFHAGVAAEARRLNVNPRVVYGATPENIEDAADTVATLLAAGHTVAQRTQFVYGVLGRSPIFLTPFGRMAGQFMTYPLKQSEFLAEKVKADRNGLIRWIALTGYFSRVAHDSGIDPTGFIGAGFIPQGAEPGVPIILPPAFSTMYHMLRTSNAAAEQDWPRFERELNRVKSDLFHLMVPAGLQVSRTFDYMKQYETYESTDPVTGALRRKLTEREQVLGLLGIPTLESRLSRELVTDMMSAQKREQWHRSYIVNSMLDYIEEVRADDEKHGTSTIIANDEQFMKLIGQARSWGLSISHEQVNNAATRRELSSYLRQVLRNKTESVEMFNRYLMAVPQEAEELGLQPIGRPENE